MLRLAVPATLFAFVGAGVADEKKPAVEPPAVASKLERFQGKWVTTVREHKEGEKVRHVCRIIEFKGDRLAASTELDGEKLESFSFAVTGLDAIQTVSGEVDMSRFILSNGTTRYAVYYEFVGDRLVLVGNLPNRPYEGYSLSGEFTRTEKPK